MGQCNAMHNVPKLRAIRAIPSGVPGPLTRGLGPRVLLATPPRGRHTRNVKVAIIAGVLIAWTGAARSDAVPVPAQTDPDAGDFWRDVVEPHADEVRALVAKSKLALQSAEQGAQADVDPTGQERMRFYRETFRVLRYARRLAPENLEVLRLYAQAADELGHTRAAIEALEAAVQIAGAEQAGPEITGRLGSIYLRLGQLDDAIRYLHAAQGPVVPGNMTSARVLIDLSTALALRGQTGEAIDVLANAIPPQMATDYTPELQLVKFALAVQYDRDEQRSAAFEVLDHLETVLQGQFGQQLQVALSQLRYAPPEDEHYYRALYYEALGHFAEARAEWALYAAAGIAPYRGRALDHITGIDAQRRAPSQPQAQLPRRYRMVHPIP